MHLDFAIILHRASQLFFAPCLANLEDNLDNMCIIYIFIMQCLYDANIYIIN